MVTLHPTDQALITGSAIAPEVAAERGYRTITTPAELKRLGFADYQARPGLLIPVHSVNGEQTLYQLRPHKPRTFTDDNDKRKTIKYETPAGGVMQLDVHPRVRPQLQDVNVPLWLTEGIRKGDAAVSAGLCCVALLGVWNWRRDGSPLPDWDAIALEGRSVTICFDSDVMIKPEVEKALRALRRFLEARGAIVQQVYLPDAPDGAKVGLDDFLASGGDVEQLQALATPELRHAPDDDEDSEPLRKLRKSQLGRQLRGLADVQPHGGLKFSREITPAGLQKAARLVYGFYRRIDDAMKWDLIDLWVAVRPGVNHGEHMNVKDQLFGRWSKQLGNWMSRIGDDFACNRDGRRRPHLPIWLHERVRDLNPAQQETVFDTFEAEAYMTQDRVQDLIRSLTGEETAQETQTAPKGTPGAPGTASSLVTGAWARCAQLGGEELAQKFLQVVQAFGVPKATELFDQVVQLAVEKSQEYQWDALIGDENPRETDAENTPETADFEIENAVSNFTAVKFEEVKTASPEAVSEPVSVPDVSCMEEDSFSHTPIDSNSVKFHTGEEVPLRLVCVESVPDADLPDDLLPFADLIADHRAGRLPDGWMRLNPETGASTTKFDVWVKTCLRSYSEDCTYNERQRVLWDLAEAAVAWRNTKPVAAAIS